MSWDAPNAEWWIALHKAVDGLSAQYPEAAHVLSLVPEHVVMPEIGDVPGDVRG